MKKTNDGAARWWTEDKGFYMVLLLCVLAVAAACYVLFVSPGTTQADPMDGYLYEADDSVTASEPLERVPAMDTAPAADEGTDAAREDGDDAADSGAAARQTETDEPPARETAANLTFTPPMDTEVARAFSGDTLEYDETTRDWRVHGGADYAGSAGDAVCAIADGTVVTVGEDTIYGRYVVLSHAQDMSSLYAGLDDIAVAEGDTVKGGAQLAVLGEPMPLEAKQGIHLHLAVTKEEKAVDPEGLF